MAYPDRSNFNSAGAEDAWFKYVNGTQTFICKGSGSQFIRGMQLALRNSIFEPTITYDRSMINGTQIVVDGKWGALTSKALWTFLSRLVASSQMPMAILDGLASEARLRRVGSVSMVAAIAASFLGADPSRQFSDLRIEGLPSNGPIPPVWNTEPPASSGGGTVCTIESVAEPEPAPAVPAEVISPPHAPLPEPHPTTEEVTAGVISPTPVGVVGEPVVIGSGVPLGAIAVVGVGVIFLAALGYMLSQEGKRMPALAPARSMTRRPTRSARGQNGRR